MASAKVCETCGKSAAWHPGRLRRSLEQVLVQRRFSKPGTSPSSRYQPRGIGHQAYWRHQEPDRASSLIRQLQMTAGQMTAGQDGRTLARPTIPGRKGETGGGGAFLGSLVTAYTTATVAASLLLGCLMSSWPWSLEYYIGSKVLKSGRGGRTVLKPGVVSLALCHLFLW